MEQTIGYIHLVQENRFVLEGDDGDTHLFVLSPRNSCLPEDLRTARRARRRVSVRYRVSGEHVASVAESVEPEDQPGARLSRRALIRTLLSARRDWSLPRQLIGQSERTVAAKSSESRRLGPRLLEADT